MRLCKFPASFHEISPVTQGVRFQHCKQTPDPRGGGFMFSNFCFPPDYALLRWGW